MVDASIALAWVLRSQATEASERLLDEVQGGARVVVPSLWLLEVANALLVLERRRRVRAEERREALPALQALSPVVDDEGPRLAFTTLAELAEAYDLAIYDAVYLELALRRRLPLGTKDDTLHDAVRHAGGQVR